MSFKRDSIDTSLLNNLKFRRVSEILAQQIPEDEARLLSNGRLTCLVCIYRPIFDNVNMLSIHRKGRRHIAELSKYLLHKRASQLSLQKTNQLKELQANSKNQGIKINEEKNMETKEDLDTFFSGHKLKALPRLSCVPYSSCSSSSCSKKRSEKFSSTMKRKMTLEAPNISPRSSALVMEVSPSARSEVRRYIKGLQRAKPFSKVVEMLKEGYGFPSAHQGTSTDTDKCVIKKGSSVENTVSSSHAGNVTPNLQHPSTLIMSGWIWKNSVDGGKWMKDPDAEFDSEEEDS